MNIFITGGTGFIGKYVVHHILNMGHYITAIYRQNSLIQSESSDHLEWVQGDLKDDWRKDLKEIDVLIHLASQGVVEESDNWESCFQTNVIDSLSLWNQAIEAGVNRFIIIGSCFEYGSSANLYEKIPVHAPLKPLNAYGASKAAASIAACSLCKSHKLELVIIRPFHVYGIGEHKSRFWPSLVEAAKNDRDFHMTKGEQIRDFQSVDETAKEISMYLNKNIEKGNPLIVNIGSGKSMRLIEFAKAQWKKYGAKGRILKGSIPYRSCEVMRYVPLIDKGS